MIGKIKKFLNMVKLLYGDENLSGIVSTVIFLIIITLVVVSKIQDNNEIKEVKDQVIEEVVVNPYKSRVEVKTVKKVYKKTLPPEAKVVVSDKKSKNLLTKITYKELLPKEQKKSIRVKRFGFYIQPKICLITGMDGTNIGGGVRFFWYSYYGLDFGVTERNLYYGCDRRLGDIYYKLKNVTVGVVKTKEGFAFNLGILF